MAQKTYTPEEWELYVREQLGPQPKEFLYPIQTINSSPNVRGAKPSYRVNGQTYNNIANAQQAAKNPAFVEWNNKKTAFDTAYQAGGGTFDTDNLPTGKGGLAGVSASLVPQAIDAIGAGGNTAIFNQKENEGSFTSVGSQDVQTNQQLDAVQNTETGQNTQTQEQTTANQATTTGQNTQGTQQTNQTQTSSEVNNALGSLSGSTTQVGETVSSVQDTLGLGALLGQQGQQAVASDAVRNQFLSDTVQSGTGQLQRNVGDAVAQALSGPGMINAGEGARARAVGAATQAVARDEFNNQLAASGQLNQLSGLGQLAQVGQGYAGQTQQTANTANTQQNTSQQNVSQGLNSLIGNTSTNQNQTGFQNTASNQNTTGAQNQTGFQNTASTQNQTGTQNTNSTQSGISNVSSTGIGFGEQPVQQGGGGGSFICAICAKHGFLTSSLVKQVAEKVKANKNFYKKQIIGYYFWSQPIAKLLLKLPLLCGFIAPFAERICQGFIEETPTKGQKFLLSVFNYLNSLGFLLSKGKFPNIDPKLLEVVKEYYEPLTFE